MFAFWNPSSIEVHYQLKKFTEMLTGGQPPPHWRGEGTLLGGASAVRGAPLSSPLCTNASENVYITGTYRISLIVSKYAGARNSPSYSTIFCHWNLSCKVKFRSQMWYLFPPFVSTSKEGSKQYLFWYPLPIRLGAPENWSEFTQVWCDSMSSNVQGKIKCLFGEVAFWVECSFSSISCQGPRVLGRRSRRERV